MIGDLFILSCAVIVIYLCVGGIMGIWLLDRYWSLFEAEITRQGLILDDENKRKWIRFGAVVYFMVMWPKTTYSLIRGRGPDI